MSNSDKIYDLAESVGAQLGVGLVSRRGDQIELPLEVLAMMLRAAHVHGLTEAAGVADTERVERNEKACELDGDDTYAEGYWAGGAKTAWLIGAKLRETADSVREGSE